MVMTDEILDGLRMEDKNLPADWAEALSPKPKRHSAYLGAQLELLGVNNHLFRLIVTRSTKDPFDFSIVLLNVDKRTGERFILVRHNGDHGAHTNTIERNVVTGCHVHLATQKYQERGLRIDGYAVKTAEYSSFSTALDSMIRKYNFKEPGRPKLEEYVDG